ncbi:unnamed protein product [Acanthoscelides obtectus]|uniref:Uncharacterized protein n=1 Tax=Acanthoscelides obtectus TaxID=200917 RepID=A0A9P0M931_ACAOB|nr:unnamed protein product [Acanthoscelides obtectus]CAK1656053.1 hypothetical protein AOBTE_LOCUS19549 [Acanthoscelides obtectus]
MDYINRDFRDEFIIGLSETAEKLQGELLGKMFAELREVERGFQEFQADVSRLMCFACPAAPDNLMV